MKLGYLLGAKKASSKVAGFLAEDSAQCASSRDYYRLIQYALNEVGRAKMPVLLKGAVFMCLLIAACRAAESSCRDWDIGSCADHEGCTPCVLDLSWAKVNFCVEQAIAEKLPEGDNLYCGSKDPLI